MTTLAVLLVLLGAGTSWPEYPSEPADLHAKNYQPPVPVRMPAPPWDYFRADSAAVVIDTVRLVPVSSAPNDITDDREWFERNGLSLPEFEAPNPFRGTPGDLPAGAPLWHEGAMLVRAIGHDGGAFLVYGADFGEGRYLALADEWMLPRRIYDFGSYVFSPGDVPADREFVAQAVSWVARRDNTLYVAHRHRTYAASSGGLNGYITAIDLETNRVIWRTRPLVCNTVNFEVYGDVIFCGYGFTDEDDYVYVLNRFTGEVVQRLPVKTGPDYCISKDGKLYVRCYDTDYVFGIETGQR